MLNIAEWQQNKSWLRVRGISGRELSVKASFNLFWWKFKEIIITIFILTQIEWLSHSVFLIHHKVKKKSQFCGGWCLYWVLRPVSLGAINRIEVINKQRVLIEGECVNNTNTTNIGIHYNFICMCMRKYTCIAYKCVYVVWIWRVNETVASIAEHSQSIGLNVLIDFLFHCSLASFFKSFFFQFLVLVHALFAVYIYIFYHVKILSL